MAADDFFARWSRRKQGSSAEPAAATPDSAEVAAAALAEPAGKPLPTMDDVSRLTHDSDYSRFVGRGVDASVKLSALKKLFSNPHFNIMDGLDTYIEDYNVFEPIPPEMLRMLNHAKTLLDPSGQFENPLMALLEKAAETGEKSGADEELRIDQARTGQAGVEANEPGAIQSGPVVEMVAGEISSAADSKEGTHLAPAVEGAPDASRGFNDSERARK